MCGSIVDIHSATAEIRREKIRRRKKNEPQGKKIKWPVLFHRAAIINVKTAFIQTVNGDRSKIAKIIKGNINHNNIDIQAMLLRLILLFRSSRRGVCTSVRPYVYVLPSVPKSLSDFDLIWCVGRPRPHIRISMTLTRSKVKVKVTELQSSENRTFLGLSHPPFSR